MVSSGYIRSDMNYLKSALNSYSKEVDSLAPNWKGQSSESLIPKFENFVSEYTGIIEEQMSSFATACDLYEQFLSYKRNRDRAQSNYNSAVSNNNTNDASYWSGVISDYNKKIATARIQIDNALSSVVAQKLIAEKKYNTTVDDAVKWAIDIANDNDYGYEIGGMGDQSGYKYDCASLIASAWQAAGVDLMGYGFQDWRAVSGLENALNNSGQFEKMDVYGYVSEDDLQPGDVLVKSKQHAIMYVGDGQYVAAHGKYVVDNYDDQISVTNYSSGYWDHVYRYVGDD